jgi:hypothetical protein
MAGRRWVPLNYLVTVPLSVHEDGAEVHRIVPLSGTQYAFPALESGYEYRLVFVPERGLWRCDRRVFVVGG